MYLRSIHNTTLLLQRAASQLNGGTNIKTSVHQCAHGVDSTVQEYTHLLKTFPSVILRILRVV